MKIIVSVIAFVCSVAILAAIFNIIIKYIEDLFFDKQAELPIVKKKTRREDIPDNPLFGYIDFPGAIEAYEKSSKDPPKIICSVCGKEITQEEIKNHKAHINYMVEGIGASNVYLHKRCMNNKVLQYENQ